MESSPPAARVELSPPDVPIGSPTRVGSEHRRAGRRSLGPVAIGLLVCALLVGGALVLSAPPRSASTADELRRMISEIGGLRATSIGTATGAFDLVTFDATSPDRLLAVHRDSYGPAQNQLDNELWEVSAAGVTQELWAPRTAHDFAQYNADGSITTWVHSGDDVGFAPRSPLVFDDGDITELPGAVYASRSATAGRAVFVLTGSPDYYASAEPYGELVALTADGITTLASGADLAWITAPSEDLVIAYPTSEHGRTVVYDPVTLDPLAEHPLAGRAHARTAVSGDGSTAVAIRFDGRMEVIDLRDGSVSSVFGSVVPAPVDRPIELDHDGRIAVTLDHRGVVSVWWVGDDEPLAVIAGDIAPTRWLPERRAPSSATAIAPDASRIALRLGARPGVEVRWEILQVGETAWADAAARP